MQNSDEASPSNILAGRAFLVKMQKELLSYCLYSRTVSNYFESKSDVYFLLIGINLSR